MIRGGAIRVLARLLLALLCLAAPLGAQQNATPPVAQGSAAATDAQESLAGWSVVSTRAEGILGSGNASLETLDVLRAELVDWRARFQTAQSPGSARIDTLRAQIAALGPAPAEGATEAPDIAAQREELATRLEALQAPIRAAEASFTEANGFIAETDRQIEAARARDLLRKGPAPVNPLAWPPAAAALGGWVADVGRGLWAPFATPQARAEWRSEGVELGILVFVAILLIWRSGVWLGRLRDRIVPREASSALTRVALFTVTFLRAVLPALGLLVVALIALTMGVGPQTEAVALLLPQVGLAALLSRWLAVRALPRSESAIATLPVGPTGRREARLHFVALGVLLSLSFALREVAFDVSAVAAVSSVPEFALQVLAGINMVRLGQLLLAGGREVQPGDVDGAWAKGLRVAGGALLIVGIAAPVCAGLGYVQLGMALIWPAVLTLGVVALVGVLQAFLYDVNAAVTRRADAGRDALAPTLAGFVLALAAVPLLVLIWGVRVATLGEWWGRFLRGFTLGDTRISPASFLLFAAVFLAGYVAVRMVKGVLAASVLPKTKLDSGGTNAILSGTSYVGLTIAGLVAITAAGIDLSGIAIVAGALSVGIGFGLQTIVQNFVSGIILLIERPIKIGDWIQVGAVEGFVREISVRSTRIETFDRQDVIVPNADLISGVVTNYTLSNSAGRVVVTVGVAYGSDTRRVERILQEVAEAHPMVILNPPPLVTFDGFGPDSLAFTIRVVLRDILFKVIVHSELNHAIAERLAAEGLEIPFAQRDIWLRNPEALRPGPPEEARP